MTGYSTHASYNDVESWNFETEEYWNEWSFKILNVLLRGQGDEVGDVWKYFCQWLSQNPQQEVSSDKCKTKLSSEEEYRNDRFLLFNIFFSPL